MGAKKIRALNHTDRVVSWTMHGIHFGYPPCCIGEFVIRAVKNDYTSRGDRKLQGTGYVPCIRCEQRSIEELLAYIEANRHHNKPFPNQD